MRIEDLRQFLDQTVTLRMKDGEVLKAKITFLDEHEEELIAAVVESSRAEYQRAPCALHTFAVDDIESIQEVAI